MSNMLKVAPIDGLQVRKEDGSIMPADGCEVSNTSYYRRRIKDGDLTVVEATAPEAATDTEVVAKAKTKQAKEAE